MASKNLTLEVSKLQKRIEELETKTQPKIFVVEEDRDFSLAGILPLNNGLNLVIRWRKVSQELRFSLIDSNGNNVADMAAENKLLHMMLARDRCSLD